MNNIKSGSSNRKFITNVSLGNVTEYGIPWRERKKSKAALKTGRKEIPVFPVEVSYKEPNPNLKIERPVKRRRKSTRADGTNPRAKGTNPRAKKVLAS
jgi:hypothetical protein